MKSRRRVLTRFAWILLVGGAFTTIYLQVGLLPGQALRERALEKIHNWTGRRVFFSKVIFLPGIGLSLEDFRIADSKGPTLFSTKKLRVDVRILPFLFEKKIVIRNLMFESPLFDLGALSKEPAPAPIQTQISGQITVPTVPPAHTITLNSLQAEGAEALLPENVYLEQIEIRRGTARFYTADGALRETVEIADLKMAYRKPPIVDISGDIRVGSPAYATLRVNGGWDLERAGYNFFLQFKSDRVPSWLDAYQQKHILILKEGRIELAAKVSSITEKRAAFHAKARLSNAHIRAAHVSVRGKTSFDAKGIFDFDRQKFERYKGTLFLEETDLENLSAQFPRIDHVSGRVGFEPDLVTIESIRGHWNKLAFEAKGTIQSFKDLLLKGEIRSRLDIEDALALIPPEQKKLLVGFRIGGTCDALTTLKGTLKKGGTILHEHRLVVERGFLENAGRKLKLEDLNTELFMDDKGLKIHNTRFRSGSTAYRLEASIPKKPASRGAITLSTSSWRLRADYDIQGDNLRVRSGQADGFGSSMAFNGMVYDTKNPSLDLKGTLQTNLSQLESSAPTPTSHALRGAGLRGILSGSFSLAGPWNRPMKWDLRIDARSERVTIKEWCRLNQFEMQLRAQNGVIDVPYLHARSYGGSLTASYLVNLTQAPTTFNMRASASDLDLSLIADDLMPQQKDMKGSLIFQLAMNGPLSNPTGWMGSGSAGISKGQFGRTDRFKAMGKLPFVRVEGMDDVTFHQMRATFDVRDRKIRTRDLSLYGDNVNLFLDGLIGFDSRLDLSMHIRYSEGILAGALDTGGIVPFVVSEANDMISDYRVKGTLTKPVFEKSLLPVNPVGTVGKKVNSLARALVH